MDGALPIKILFAAMFGTTGLNFLFTRLYAVVSALRLRYYCWKGLPLPEQNAKANALFHDGIRAETRNAGKNILWAFCIALGLFLFLWLFGQREMYAQYLELMVVLMRAAGIACVFSELSRIVTALSLPGEITRREIILELKSNILPLLFVMFLYVVELWLYSL